MTIIAEIITRVASYIALSANVTLPGLLVAVAI